MTPTGLRKITRRFIATLIASVTVASSLALAGSPNGVWIKGNPAERAALDRDLARNGQPLGPPLTVMQVGAKDGMTPISAEVRTVQRPEQSAQMRGAGSIRADIARYNEERGTSRQPGHAGDDARSATNANYRN